jgi:hypothetical protein
VLGAVGDENDNTIDFSRRHEETLDGHDVRSTNVSDMAEARSATFRRYVITDQNQIS